MAFPTRRRFLTAAGTAAFATRSRAAAPGAQILSTRVVSPRSDLYHGWPTLAQRTNGELLVVCSGGREQHVCPFGWVEFMRSTDGGQTWSWPQVVMDTPIDDRDAGVLETPKGALLITTFTSLAYQSVLDAAGREGNWSAERLARWRSINANITEAQRQSLLGTWMLRSEDSGLTWSAPYRVPVNSPHGPIVLKDGRLLYPGKQLWTPGRRIGVAASSDDGRNWQWLAEIPTRPGDDPTQSYHELHGVEASNGRIVVHIRNHNKVNERETLQTESTDGGRTWTVPHPIGVWGLPSHLLRLKDGRLLMTYGHRRPPYGNQARLSTDHGATWSAPITLSADGADGDLGYPSTVERHDATLLTLWYERPADTRKAHLRLAHWRLAG